jgi:hypothetical protein
MDPPENIQMSWMAGGDVAQQAWSSDAGIREIKV